MARRQTHRNPTHAEDLTPKAESALPAADMAADAMTRIACSQFEYCLHAFSAVFRAAESMRSVQLDAARAARRHHESVLAKLTDAPQAPDLMNLATDLARFDTEGAMRYWQQLAETMTKLQADLLECGTRDFAALTGRYAEALSATAGDQAQRKAPLGADFASLIARLSNPMPAGNAGEAVASQAADVANQAWQRWMKLSEDWARLALQQGKAAEGAATH
jgi:phasin family protein